MKKSRLGLGITVGVLLLVGLLGCRTASSPSRNGRSAQNLDRAALRTDIPYIDAHNHIFGGKQGQNYFEASRSAIDTMSRLGISKMLVMPPPRVAGQHGSFDVYDLFPVVRKYPQQFACLGGGGTLNVMIHKYKHPSVVDPEVKERFRKQALEILSRGALGFGEFSVLHLSLNTNHPFQSAPADHPLFLLLADLAAEHGVPIDIHMEAVSRDMPLPDRRLLSRSGQNPKMLTENIGAFERLLAHNRRAKIIWSHVGWCNTGHRTHALCRKLLARNANLYMSIKLSPESVPAARMVRDDQKAIRPEWLSLMRDYPDRFFIGTDQFYTAPGRRKIGPQKTEDTRLFMNLLPADLAVRVGMDNPRELFGMP